MYAGTEYHEYSFKRKQQVTTIGSKAAAVAKKDHVQIDPQLIFQRLLIVATNEFTDLQDLFKYDICSNPVLLTPYRMRSNLNKCHNLANHSMFLAEEHCWHCFIVSFAGNTVQPFVTSAAAMCIMLLNDIAGVLLYLTVIAMGPQLKTQRT